MGKWAMLVVLVVSCVVRAETQWALVGEVFVGTHCIGGPQTDPHEPVPDDCQPVEWVVVRMKQGTTSKWGYYVPDGTPMSEYIVAALMLGAANDGGIYYDDTPNDNGKLLYVGAHNTGTLRPQAVYYRITGVEVH